MKKSIKIVLTIVLMITLINITAIDVKAYWWNDLANISQEELKSMDTETLVSKLEQLENLINTVAEDQKADVTKAYNRLNGELRLRNDAKELEEVLQMTDYEISMLSDRDLRVYISSMESYRGVIGVDVDKVDEALKKLQTELSKRNSGGYQGYIPSLPIGYDKVTDVAGNVLGIVRNFGIVIALIALTVIGVKYMLGSIEQKAEYKKSMVPFVIGVIFLAASTTLVKIIYDVVTSAGL